uniref:S-protein homolog n=1 Tax=Kalanchoe fedtschenkoi TaxID=63787 RepID=A0A7N0UGR5_KALFE
MDHERVSTSVFVILLAFAILYVMNAEVAEAHTCSWGFPKFYLSAENQMEKPATAIKIHCKSKDNDMGEHILWNGMHTSFSFRPQIFNRSFFWCDVFWNDRWVVFDAYIDRRDYDRCTDNDCDSYSTTNPICKQIKMCLHDTKAPFKYTDSKWIRHN